MSARLAAVACLVAGMIPADAAPAAGEVVRVEHYDPSTTPSRGPASALVTVELFFAPTIHGLARLPAYRALEELQRKHPTRMRIVYRVVERGAQPPGPQLPTLALEAYAQGVFFELMDLVLAQRSSLTRDQMLELAGKVGMDVARAERAIVEDRYREVLDANARRLERLRGLTAPMVFFNAQPTRASQSSMSHAEYELAYQAAHARARDLLDRGVARRDLMQAFDDEVLRDLPPVVVTTGPTDDDFEREITDHPLASPPLPLAGLPSLGDPAARAPVPVIVLCRPDDASCSATMRVARRLHNTYRGEIRVLWAPWFDVTADDAAELALLGDAALCAERIASNPIDLEASPGWLWVTEAYAQLGRAHGRDLAADPLIDAVADKLRIPAQPLSACRARMANATLELVTAARRSGVVTSPAVVIGGRIYHGLHDPLTIQRLVEAELAPGLLGRCATTGC